MTMVARVKPTTKWSHIYLSHPESLVMISWSYGTLRSSRRVDC